MCKGIEYGVVKDGLKNADNVMENGGLLPLHHGMTDSTFSRLTYYWRIYKKILDIAINLL